MMEEKQMLTAWSPGFPAGLLQARPIPTFGPAHTYAAAASVRLA
jgi:hypothetical protein